MPLIIVCGNPCTGKTTFSLQLVDYFHSKGISNVELINEESLKLSKNDGYKTSANEKSTRGALKSAVDHKLNGECYVIVDSMNYIKGFRYELYCSARTFRTPHCVIWVECDENTSNNWNNARIECGHDGYDNQIILDLRRRFEAPNESNRWDCPLFKVRSSGGSSTVAETTQHDDSDQQANKPQQTPPVEVKTVFKSSWKPKSLTKTSSVGTEVSSSSVGTTCSAPAPQSSNAVFFSGTAVRRKDDLLKDFSSAADALPAVFTFLLDAVAPTPNSSTIASHHAEADLLYELDRTSQKILATIIAHQSENVEGTPIKFVEYDRELTLHRHAGLSELQRYRRQFVKINGQHPPGSSTAVGTSFIDFLALQL